MYWDHIFLSGKKIEAKSDEAMEIVREKIRNCRKLKYGSVLGKLPIERDEKKTKIKKVK